MKQPKTVKTWQKTRLQNLLRHKSGIYYARAFAGRKEIWKSLKTSHFGVAQSKLADFMKEHRERKATANALTRGKMTFGDALAIHRTKIADDVAAKRTKPSTAHYWKQVFASLLRTWRENFGSEANLETRDIRRVTPAECEAWARKFARTASATRFNNTIAALRHVFDVAVEAAVIYSNPAAKLVRMPIRQKELALPTAKQFLDLVDTIRGAGGGCSHDCADFVEGLAVTGIRLSDAGRLKGPDIDFDSGEITVRGDAKTGTKNWEIYRVPLIPRARELFARMRAERPFEWSTENVFRVAEAQRAIDRACRKLGIPRITHHDLRHLFATICIESGVDIPTVSRWLNHKDGGALAMRTYAHLRREHSQASAMRVKFTAGNMAPDLAKIA